MLIGDLDYRELRRWAEISAQQSGFTRTEAEDIASDTVYRCLKAKAATCGYARLAIRSVVTDAIRSARLRRAYSIETEMESGTRCEIAELGVDPWPDEDVRIMLDSLACPTVQMRRAGYDFEEIGAAIGLGRAGAKTRYRRAVAEAAKRMA